MKRTIVLLIVLDCILQTACTDKKIGRNNLSGRYIFQTWGQDTIEVSSNGKYLHYNTIEHKRLKNSGTWTYDSIAGRMIFANFSFLTDNLPSGYWDTKVDLVDDEVRLIYASDVHKAYYLKVDSIDRGG